jgi:hypothetical protein
VLLNIFPHCFLNEFPPGQISEDVANLFAASPGADAEQMRWTRAAAGGGRNDGGRVNGLQQTAVGKSSRDFEL